METDEEIINALLKLRDWLELYHDNSDKGELPASLINKYLQELGYDFPPDSPVT